MGLRHQSREYALQILYTLDISKFSLEEIIQEFLKNEKIPENVKEFAQQLVYGTIQHQEEIDSLIKEHTQNWSLERMFCVDRNILRIATFEILYLFDIPTNVIINESIELAKKYGSQDSPKFVNAIIDKIKNCRKQ